MEVTFLGTGASGGTPGTGRSRRRESSVLVRAGATTILVDVTRAVADQLGAHLPAHESIDLILLTHAHRDASGGLARLREWMREREHPEDREHRSRPVRLVAHPAAIERVRRRHRRLHHVDPQPLEPGRSARVGRVTITAAGVPHGGDTFPTLAFRLAGHGARLVYASDVGALTPELEGLARGADLLVLDGAMWDRRLFSHLTVRDALPRVCRWRVQQVALTQIGRNAPDHGELAAGVRALCERAVPAHDGMVLRVGR